MKIDIAVIHNRNAQRNEHLFPHVEALAAQAGARATYFAWQPPVEPLGARAMLARWRYYYGAAIRWNRYCEAGPLETWRPALGFVRRVARFLLGATARREATKATIEILVTAKHLRSWERFIESDADALVCFEDDAVFEAGSLAALQAALAQRLAPAPGPAYLDLAGGYFPDLSSLARHIARRDGNAVEFRKPVTNSSCAYAMNRELVGAFLGLLQREPRIRLLPIDWAVNELFMRLGKAGVRVACVHFEPPLVRHGSTSGAYASWNLGLPGVSAPPVGAPPGV